MSERWQALVAEFRVDLERRGRSPKTQLAYALGVRDWLGWLAQTQPGLPPGEVTSRLLEAYLAYLVSRPRRPSGPPSRRQAEPGPLTAATRNQQLTALRAFFRFLRRRGEVAVDPSRELEYTRTPPRLPPAVPSVAEVHRLLMNIDLSTPLGWRTRAALELLYATGVRRSELLGLTLPDLDLREESVRVRGKGNRERLLPVGTEAVRVLRVYLESMRGQLPTPDEPWLFLSPRAGPMSAREFLETIREAARRARIQKKLGFHSFRHACASHLLAGRADIRHIQALLGHYVAS